MPIKQHYGAAKLAQKNIKSLAGYGIDVDINKNPELAYLAHQQGAKGAADIIKAAQTGGPVSERLRKTMDANGGKGMTPAQFLEHWKTTYNKKAGQVGHTVEETAQPASDSKAQTTAPVPSVAPGNEEIGPIGKPAPVPQAAQIEPVPASGEEAEKRKTISEMLGIPPEALPVAGQGVAWTLNQQNAIPEMYRNKSRDEVKASQQGSDRSQSANTTSRRANSAPQQPMREVYAKQTFTGSEALNRKPNSENLSSENLQPSPSGVTSGELLNPTNGESASNLLTPQSYETSGPLESAGFDDKRNEANAVASRIPTPQPSSSGATRVSPERGSNMMTGDQAPLEVRNSESSIRRLTDLLISFSFG